jgi:hypothetical protein
MRRARSDIEAAGALLTAVAAWGICGRPVRSELVTAGQLAYRCDSDDGRTRPEAPRRSTPGSGCT